MHDNAFVAFSNGASARGQTFELSAAKSSVIASVLASRHCLSSASLLLFVQPIHPAGSRSSLARMSRHAAACACLSGAKVAPEASNTVQRRNLN
ncbi:hypothetical protein [Caballeronia sp. HLA56]